jgi:hypothetical protein
MGWTSAAKPTFGTDAVLPELELAEALLAVEADDVPLDSPCGEEVVVDDDAIDGEELGSPPVVVVVAPVVEVVVDELDSEVSVPVCGTFTEVSALQANVAPAIRSANRAETRKSVMGILSKSGLWQTRRRDTILEVARPGPTSLLQMNNQTPIRLHLNNR